MIICGIDYSISSPAVVKAELDDDLEIIGIDYISFSSTLKNCKLDDHLVHNVKKNFRNDIERFQFLRDNVEEFMYGGDAPEYVAIEGYAMGATGKIFNIAEATILTKSMIYDHDTSLRIYTPSAIKKYATGKGNVNKVSMFEQFNKEEHKFLKLDHLQDLKNPQEDIIDGYFIMKLLQMELKLRYGMVELKSLPLKKIEVFNAISKSNPENILTREFIKKNDS